MFTYLGGDFSLLGVSHSCKRRGRYHTAFVWFRAPDFRLAPTYSFLFWVTERHADVENLRILHVAKSVVRAAKYQDKKLFYHDVYKR